MDVFDMRPQGIIFSSEPRITGSSEKKNCHSFCIASREKTKLSWNHSGRIGQAYTLFQMIELSGILQQHPAGKSYIVVRDLTKQELMQEMNIWLDMISSQDTMQKKNQEDLQLD